MGSEETVVRFTLGGLLFEYDPSKNRKNIENMGSRLRVLPVCFLIMTESNSMMRLTVGMKTAMIR